MKTFEELFKEQIKEKQNPDETAKYVLYLHERKSDIHEGNQKFKIITFAKNEYTEILKQYRPSVTVVGNYFPVFEKI